MTKELKRFEQWWDAEDDIPNNGPYTPDTPIQFAWAGWQAALAEQPEQKRPQNCGTGYCSCIECVMEPAQQEPVAWMSDTDVGFKKSEFGATPTVPLYTSPPAQRTWVGLTDDERLEVAEIDGADEWFWKVCKAIEAKLKELNT